MKRIIIFFRQDEYGDWFAELECGHTCHFRHHPPWRNHPWVTTKEGREQWIGAELDCKECDLPIPSIDMQRETSAIEDACL